MKQILASELDDIFDDDDIVYIENNNIDNFELSKNFVNNFYCDYTYSDYDSGRFLYKKALFINIDHYEDEDDGNGEELIENINNILTTINEQDIPVVPCADQPEDGYFFTKVRYKIDKNGFDSETILENNIIISINLDFERKDNRQTFEVYSVDHEDEIVDKIMYDEKYTGDIISKIDKIFNDAIHRYRGFTILNDIKNDDIRYDSNMVDIDLELLEDKDWIYNPNSEYNN